MNYPHPVRHFSKEAGVETSANASRGWDSLPAAPKDVTHWQGLADVQDAPSRYQRSRLTGGDESEAEAILFLPSGAPMPEEGHFYETPYGTAVVKGLRRLDRTVFLTWI